MTHRIAALALAIAFLIAAPLGASEGMDSCAPCCPQPAEAACASGEIPCESLATGCCCELTPAAAASVAQRSVDGPALLPVARAVRTRSQAPRTALPPPGDGDLALLTSPLRLSVVLLI